MARSNSKNNKVVLNNTNGKRTSIGHGKVKTSSMNKNKRRAYKQYRGQGR